MIKINKILLLFFLTVFSFQNLFSAELTLDFYTLVNGEKGGFLRTQILADGELTLVEQAYIELSGAGLLYKIYCGSTEVSFYTASGDGPIWGSNKTYPAILARGSHSDPLRFGIRNQSTASPPPEELHFTSEILFNTQVGDQFSYTVSASGGTGNITVEAGGFPSWLTYQNGTIHIIAGMVPAGLTKYTFLIEAQDDIDYISDTVQIYVGIGDDYEDDESESESGEDDLTGNEDGNQTDNDDDVPTLNQIKEAVCLHRKDMNKFRHKTYTQLNDIKTLLAEIRDNAGNNIDLSGDSDDADLGSVVVPTLSEPVIPEIPEHDDLPPDSAINDAIINNNTLICIQSKIAEIQAVTPSGNTYLEIPLNSLYDGFENPRISFYENPTLNTVRLAIRNTFIVVVWIFGFYSWFIIIKPVFQVKSYLG